MRSNRPPFCGPGVFPWFVDLFLIKSQTKSYILPVSIWPNLDLGLIFVRLRPDFSSVRRHDSFSIKSGLHSKHNLFQEVDIVLKFFLYSQFPISPISSQLSSIVLAMLPRKQSLRAPISQAPQLICLWYGVEITDTPTAKVYIRTHYYITYFDNRDSI